MYKRQGLFQIGGLRDVGVADHIIKVLHAFAALFAQLHHGGHHLVIAAYLGFHLGLAVDQGDDCLLYTSRCV